MTHFDKTSVLRKTHTKWQKPAGPTITNQLAFPSSIGSRPNAPHGVRTLADNRADASFILQQFLNTTKALRTIPLALLITCEAYDGRPSKQITKQVEFYLRIGLHFKHTHAYVVDTCSLFDLILGF
jgi:hypothetical protein